MAQNKIVKSVRVSQALDQRIKMYANNSGFKEADAVRDLLEKGLACESLSVFTTPVGSLIRDVVEAEFNLLRAEMQEQSEATEERVARVCSRGTKASLQTAAMLTDVSRAIIPAWRETKAADLWGHYARMGGALQSGRSYEDVKAQG